MKKLAAPLVLALAAFALVACGGDSSGTTTTTTDANSGAAAEAGGGNEGGGSTVDIEADPNGALAYTTDSATAEAGNVTIDFTNPQALTHDVAIEDESGEMVGKTELIEEGETSEQVKLKAGEYTFYCTVPGHREAGMEGTLTVE